MSSVNTQRETASEAAQTIPDIHPGGASSSTTDPSQRSIAIITCSTRPERIGPYIATWLSTVISATVPPSIRVSKVDLASLPEPLPLLDEAELAAKRPKDDPTPHYEQSHTRAWSKEIRRHDAFVFVTPQYNWGYPASIKNALDFLYHEWTDKPAMVVSYGGHGGGKAAEQLVSVLKGLKMRVVESMPGVTIRVSESPHVRDEGHFSEERINAWKEAGVDKEAQKGIEDLVSLLMESQDAKL